MSRAAEPTRREHRPAGRSRAALVGLLAAALLSACSAQAATPDRAATSRPAPSSAVADSSLPPLPASPAPLPASVTSPPVTITLPTIGVTSSLEPLGILADGTLAPPSTFPEAGWYSGGVRPGDPGPAIIAGHVDSVKGPAVFYELPKLAPGDPAIVTRADGSTVTFVVESKAQYPKSQFPTSAVYGPTPTPELRLVTCTGVFDRSIRSYEDNLVVTAVLQQ